MPHLVVGGHIYACKKEAEGADCEVACKNAYIIKGRPKVIVIEITYRYDNSIVGSVNKITVGSHFHFQHFTSIL